LPPLSDNAFSLYFRYIPRRQARLELKRELNARRLPNTSIPFIKIRASRKHICRFRAEIRRARVPLTRGSCARSPRKKTLCVDHAIKRETLETTLVASACRYERDAPSSSRSPFPRAFIRIAAPFFDASLIVPDRIEHLRSRAHQQTHELWKARNRADGPESIFFQREGGGASTERGRLSGSTLCPSGTDEFPIPIEIKFESHQI